MDENIVEEGDDFICVCVGSAAWTNAQGMHFLEEDFTVNGEIWRVHKNDPDPYPSNPHAHCVAGADRFVGCKLHLGTRELFDSKNKPLGRFLLKKTVRQIDRPY